MHRAVDDPGAGIFVFAQRRLVGGLATRSRLTITVA